MAQSIIRRSLMKTSLTARLVGGASWPWYKLCVRNASLLTTRANIGRLQGSQTLPKPTTTTATALNQIVQRNIFSENKKEALVQLQNDSRNTHNENVDKPEARILAIFDFDQTIISQDSDTVVAEILSPIYLWDKESFDEMEKDGWIAFMITILQYLQEEGITAVQMAQTVRCIPEVPGMVRLIREISCINGIDMIVLSDANTFFITEWLNGQNLRELFSIISNPAQPKCDGQLALCPLMHQTICTNCPSNLCKGAVLKQLMEDSCANGIDYKRILYVGDGVNDYCAVSRMKRCCDIICARRDYELAALLKATKHEATETPQIILWSDGTELLTRLQEETTLFNASYGNTNREGGETNALPQFE